ncbi:hypothetical protein SEUCBS139899_007075 [Sporothrix eucalyptigena]
MGPEARLVAEYQRLEEEEEAAARAIEEAVSRHRRIRKQRESVRLRGVAMLRKVEEELFDEDKAHWEEEERQAAQQATPDVPSTLGLASASFDWGAIMAELGPVPPVANTPSALEGSS